MKAILFGSKGMLGRYISKFLKEKGYDVINLSREDFNITKATYKNIYSLINKYNNINVVINCAAVIKPRIKETGEANTLIINSVFPRILADVCESKNINCIHISTDGVFSGTIGSYTEDDSAFVLDFYGQTKLLGEPNNCTVMRVCPIGEEINQTRSLIEWVKSCKNGTANGFTNHIWNGLTGLQVAKVIYTMVSQNIFWKGFRHIYSPQPVSKSELLHIINDIYQLNIDITDMEGPTAVDRSLSTKYTFPSITFNIPPIPRQIKELKGYL